MFTVYVLKSLKNNYRYIGQTNNLPRRLEEHNLGSTPSIRFQRPFRLIYSEEFPTRQRAVIREKHLKSGQGRQWLTINGY